MRTARWLRSGPAVNIKFPGTEFRRGPSQLHSIQECGAWTTATWSRRQNAHIPFWTLSSHHMTEEVYGWREKNKTGKVYLSKRAVSARSKSAPQCNKLPLNPNCTLLQTISINPSCSAEKEGETEGEREREREWRGSYWRKSGVLVHNYSRDLWPEKQFINHSAWANVLQIVLHAAAILVCVKRHNKPG